MLHGDAAVAGQGVASEAACLAGLEGYDVGGTLHVVVDNHVGFTTPPAQQRTAPHAAASLAAAAGAPVLFANGADAEACVDAAQLAAAYRAEFGADCVLSLSCFRRLGHHEVNVMECYVMQCKGRTESLVLPPARAPRGTRNVMLCNAM